MKIKNYIIFTCLLLAGCSTTTKLSKNINISDIYKAEQVSRIAIFDLEFKALASEKIGKTNISRNQDAGRIMADLLVSDIVGIGLYRVIERTEITKILEENNFSNSSLADQKDAKELGALLGVDGIVFGTVHNYDLWDWGGGVVWGSNVSFSARLVSTKTGEIVWTINGCKNTERKLTIDLAREVVTSTISALQEKLNKK